MGFSKMTSMALLFAALFSFQVVMSIVMSASPYSQSVNDVGFNVAKELGHEGNQFISPVSIYMALAMTHLGSNSNTKEQLEKALNLLNRGVSPAELHLKSQSLINLYSEASNDYNLTLTDGMFVQQGYPLKTTFVNNMKNFYRGAIKSVDFVQNGEDARRDINSWVARSTLDLIPEFLNTPLDPSTVLAVLNVVYFKGSWKTQFNPKHTAVGTFNGPNNQKKEVSLMKLRHVTFKYYEDVETGYKFLEMPYKGQHLSMLLTLPMDSRKYPDIDMSNEIISRITRNVKNTKLAKVVVPKFRMEYERDLKEALKSMGVQDLFTSAADLSGISDRRDLQVSAVLHKAIVEVNEEGSEAAAVTGVIINTKSIFVGPEFVADRPFLFYIMDNRVDIVLFAGRLVEP